MATPAAVMGVRPQRREDFIESFWRFFSSLSLVIPLIFALAIACIAGTFVNPQNTPLTEIAKAFGDRWWWHVYLSLELYDLFHSWWFTLLLLLLALNIIACTIERLPRLALIVLHPDVKLTDKVARGIKQVFRLKAGDDVQAEASRVAAAFRARGFEPRVVSEGDTVYLFAQKGWWARFGVWVVHASLLMMLGGGIAGRVGGFEGAVDVPGNGGTFDSIFVRTSTGESYPRKLPWVVRVNAFDVEFYKTGTPKLFRSDVSVLDATTGKQLQRQNVEVNHPLYRDGLAIYQASYREDPSGMKASLDLVDKTTGKRQGFMLARGEDATAANGVTYAVEAYTAKFGELGPAAQIRRLENGKSSDFWVFENKPEFDAANRPDRYAVEFKGLKQNYYTGLQIAHDPGTKWVFLGCAMLVSGLLVAFQIVHRRLWARVEKGAIVLAGSTHKNAGSFEQLLADLREKLARA